MKSVARIAEPSPCARATASRIARAGRASIVELRRPVYDGRFPLRLELADRSGNGGPRVQLAAQAAAGCAARLLWSGEGVEVDGRDQRRAVARPWLDRTIACVARPRDCFQRRHASAHTGADQGRDARFLRKGACGPGHLRRGTCFRIRPSTGIASGRKLTSALLGPPSQSSRFLWRRGDDACGRRRASGCPPTRSPSLPVAATQLAPQAIGGIVGSGCGSWRVTGLAMATTKRGGGPRPAGLPAPAGPDGTRANQ
jgi:hypothetical protein